VTFTARTRVDGRTSCVAIQRHDTPLSRGEAFEGWRTSAEFRAFFLEQLARSSSPACFWETPPVTLATLDRPFEFVLVDAPPLERVAPEPHVFRTHYACADEGITTFENLGRDALLVAPAPVSDPRADFSHLTAFTRTARPELQHALWRAVGRAAEERLGDAPLWISTSGLGVSWLHVRLDSIPKYYTHAPYREL